MELEAQESNTSAELFDRLAGKSTVKDLEGTALLQWAEADPESTGRILEQVQMRAQGI